MPYELFKTDKLYYPDKPDKLNKPGKSNWLEKVKAFTYTVEGVCLDDNRYDFV